MVDSKEAPRFDTGWSLPRVLTDGLYLNAAGNRVSYQEIRALCQEIVFDIEDGWPNAKAEHLPFALPHQADAPVWKHLER